MREWPTGWPKRILDTLHGYLKHVVVHPEQAQIYHSDFRRPRKRTPLTSATNAEEKVPSLYTMNTKFMQKSGQKPIPLFCFRHTHHILLHDDIPTYQNTTRRVLKLLPAGEDKCSWNEGKTTVEKFTPSTKSFYPIHSDATGAGLVLLPGHGQRSTLTSSILLFISGIHLLHECFDVPVPEKQTTWWY